MVRTLFSNSAMSSAAVKGIRGLLAGQLSAGASVQLLKDATGQFGEDARGFVLAGGRRHARIRGLADRHRQGHAAEERNAHPLRLSLGPAAAERLRDGAA